MASAVRNDRGIWLARWKDASGHWRKRAASPNTKTAAKLLADELHVQARRREEGLETLPPKDGGGTIGALLTWWLAKYSARLASHASNDSAVRLHLLPNELARMSLVACKPTDVRAFLDSKAQSGLAPQTLNHLRSYISRPFNRAIEVGRWAGSNPVEGIPKRKVPRGTVGDFLSVDEVPRVLRALHPRWRPLFATAVYTGMRKGELGALRRQDVDLEAHVIVVRRSWTRDTPKSGHARAVPIVLDLEPWLRAALQASPSDLVFPHVCARSCARQRAGCPGPGGMMRTDVALESVMRRAMGRASIAMGWRHVCRRQGCGHVEEAADSEERRCPRCTMKLWAKPQVRPVRFHDMRHTTATLLLRAGVPLVVVQKVLGHQDPRLTEAVYGHLAGDFLRTEVDRLRLEGMPAPEPLRAVASMRRVPPVSPAVLGRESGLASSGKSSATPTHSGARDTGVEPVAFSSGG